MYLKNRGWGSAEEVRNSQDRCCDTARVFCWYLTELVFPLCLCAEDAACPGGDTATGSTGSLGSDGEAEDAGTTSSYFGNDTNQRRKRKRLPTSRDSKRKKTGGGSQQFHPRGYVPGLTRHFSLHSGDTRTAIMPLQFLGCGL